MKYKYLKGSAEDFNGAPQRAMVKLCCGTPGCEVFADSFTNGAARTDLFSGCYDSKIIDTGNFHLIAQREPIADEDNLNGHVGSSECRVKAGELIMDGKWHEANLGASNGTEVLITERGSRYGKFKDGAEIMQSLKDTMRDVDGWNNLTASQKEALDMIQHKIGRILNGDPTYDDSWKDIAGYATLIVNELNGEIK